MESHSKSGRHSSLGHRVQQTLEVSRVFAAVESEGELIGLPCLFFILGPCLRYCENKNLCFEPKVKRGGRDVTQFSMWWSTPPPELLQPLSHTKTKIDNLLQLDKLRVSIQKNLIERIFSYPGIPFRAPAILSGVVVDMTCRQGITIPLVEIDYEFVETVERYVRKRGFSFCLEVLCTPDLRNFKPFTILSNGKKGMGHSFFHIKIDASYAPDLSQLFNLDASQACIKVVLSGNDIDLAVEVDKILVKKQASSRACVLPMTELAYSQAEAALFDGRLRNLRLITPQHHYLSQLFNREMP